MAMTEKTKLLKTKTGLTLKEIADRLGYNKTTICLVCRDAIAPSKRLARTLAELCGVDESYFLTQQQ